MKTSNIFKTAAFVTAAAFTMTTAGSYAGDILTKEGISSSIGRARPSVADHPVEVSVVSDGVTDLQKLNYACENGSSDRIAELCDTMIAEMEADKDKTEGIGADISQWADDEVIARQKQYESMMNVRYAESIKALTELRSGINADENLAFINAELAEPEEYHKSDATPNIAVQPAEKTVSASTAASSAEIVSPAATADDLVYDKGVSDPAAIKELADKLGSAKDIYFFVKNSIVNEAYLGSKKDPAITLEQLGGNDMDQAALLVYLLRAKGIPARFMSGTVRITPEQAVEITGASDAASAGRILAARYSDTARLDHNGQLVGYKLHHTWAEAYIPYTDYRGAGNAKGGSVWVQLDPSFKKVEVKKESVDPEFSENDKYYLDLVDKSKTELPGAFDDIDTSPDKIDIYVKRITEKNEEYIPSSLPYTVLEADQRYSFIKDSDKASVSISIDGEKLFSAAVSDIYSHPLIISYEPASASDKEVIERYGQLTDVPAYLVNVVPAVTCGDRKTVGKKAVSLGSAQKMITDIKDGTGNTMLDDSIFAGSMYAVNLDLQTIFGDEAKLAEERLKKAEEKCTSDNSYSPEIMGALLDYAGKYYFSLCDVQIYTQALLNNIDFSRELGLAITGYEFNRHSSCGVVDSLEDGAFHIDVAYNRTNPVSFIGSRTDEKNFNAAIGAEESFLEGCVWEKLLGQDEQGISTMSVIGKAAEMDISTVIITDTNMEEELAKCNISEAVRQEIRSFVNRGMAVEAVPETLKIGDWTGTAYIAYDMTSGSASYMISGGTAGGATARFIRLVEINNVLSFMNTAMASSAIVYGLLDFQMSCLNDDIFGATRALKSAFSGSMALGSAYRMRFGIICYAIDFAIDGESALSEFEQFTVDNFNETKANYDRIRQTMDSHALSVVSKFFGCVEDAYKEYKKIERYAKTTEKAITEGDAESGFDFALMLAELISSMFKR